MAPPPSDEELIASFTEKEREFHMWLETNQKAYFKDKFPFQESSAMLRQQWPNEEDIKQFHEWANKWLGRVIDRLTYMMPTSELIDLICTTDVLNSDSLKTLLGTMEIGCLPIVLLGESDFDGLNGYALIPGAAYLWPNHEAESEAGLMERIVLGINTSIAIEFHETVNKSDNTQSPRKRRQERSSGEDSIRTTDSGDIDAPGGFLFLQIGALYAFAGDEDWARISGLGRNIIMSGPWRPTGFGVVVRIDARGNQAGIYIIYNFYQEDEDSPDPARHHIPVFDSHGNLLSHIGCLKEGGRHFTVAHIANSLRDLKDGSRFTVTMQEQKECQIVRVKMSGAGQGHFLLRQFVRADY